MTNIETVKRMYELFASKDNQTIGKITEFNQFTDTFLIGQAMGLTH